VPRKETEGIPAPTWMTYDPEALRFVVDMPAAVRAGNRWLEVAYDPERQDVRVEVTPEDRSKGRMREVVGASSASEAGGEPGLGKRGKKKKR
jgi:hypothetical protein